MDSPHESFFKRIAVTTGVALVVTGAYYYLRVLRPKRKMLDKIPVAFPSVPFFGSLYYLDSKPSEFRRQIMKFCVEQNGPAGMCTMWWGPLPAVIIWRADYAEFLLTSHEITKSQLYHPLGLWLGNGLLTSTGDHWYQHRKLITPSFHFRILNDFIPILNEQADHLVQSLENYVDGDEFNIFPLIITATLDSICESAMGQSTDDEDRTVRKKVFQTVRALSKAIMYRQTNPLLSLETTFSLTSVGKQFKENLRLLNDYTKKLLDEKAASFDREAIELQMSENNISSVHKNRPLALLDSMLYSCENFTKMSKKDILDEINTFLFAGHDTTGAAIAWTLYLLARNPEEQKKVQAELDSICGSSNRPITMEDLKEMRYLSACLKESLRIYPPAPMIARGLEADLKIGDYVVPAGTTVICHIEALHQDPRYFEEPKKFKPERFFSTANDADTFDTAADKIPPYAYIPFSAGQRNCIGQRYALIESKILLASILRQFTVECPYAEEKIAPSYEIIMRPTNGMYMKIHYRS